MAAAAVPMAIETLVTRWRADGGRSQRGMSWQRERWVSRLPTHQTTLESLPRVLDRAEVRRRCSDAAGDAVGAEAGFLAVMAWGYGGVGYGPYRTHRILGRAGARERLVTAARILRDEGAIAAYRCLASDDGCRLVGLGPAFGTKYLYFCQPRPSGTLALILDSFVAGWLRRETDLDVNPVGWSPETYERYLHRMHAWAASIGCEPDELESAIFQAEATRRESQWRPTA